MPETLKPRTFSQEIEINGQRKRVQLADLSSIFNYDVSPTPSQPRRVEKQ